MIKKLEEIAYHEASHAVACVWLHVPIRKVSIIPTDKYAGILTHPDKYGANRDIETGVDYRTTKWVENQILVFYAGTLGERKYQGKRFNWRGASADIRSTVDLVDHITGSPEETEAFLRWKWEQAKGMVENELFWLCVQSVADELLKSREISGRRVLKLVKDVKRTYLENLSKNVRNGD